jgi:hypothetical protein
MLQNATAIYLKGREILSEIKEIIRLNNNDSTTLNSDENVSINREKLNLAIEKFNECIKISELLSDTITEFLENISPTGAAESRNKYLKYKKKYMELKNSIMPKF